MKDKEFDKILKTQISKNHNIPDEINNIFSNFEEEIRMKRKKEKNNITYMLKYVAIVCLAIMIMGVGGTTYAHIKGFETFLSPILRSIGINSKYEENAININETQEKDEIKMELLNAAIDETTLIVGYKINLANNKNSIRINNTGTINGMFVKRISNSLNKVAENEYLYYEVFNMSEIKLANAESINFEVEIYSVEEFTIKESENLGKYEHVEKTYECNFKFAKNLEINNVVENKEYEFLDKIEANSNNIKYTVDKLIKGSYTNILKITTDRTNSEYGDATKNIYTIYNQREEKIAEGVEEERFFDERKITDKIILGDIKEEKIVLEIKVECIDGDLLDTIRMDIDLSKVEEQKENKKNYKDFEKLGFKFKYDETWEYIGRYDYIDERNPEIEYFVFEIPSTTDGNEEISIWFEVSDKYESVKEYIDEFNNNLHISPGEWREKEEEGKCEFLGTDGYYFVTTMTEGDVYYSKEYIAYIDGKIYSIRYNAEEKNYNNLNKIVDEFIEDVELVK